MPKHIAIVGAGIVGVTTAYELACAGHHVTVYERHGAAAVEASFAPAGLMAPAYAAPWPSPGQPGRLLRQLGRSHHPMRLHGAWGQARWLWQWRHAARPEVFQKNRLQLHQLAQYSGLRLHQIADELGLQYERSDGVLLLLRDDTDRALLQPRLELLRAQQAPLRELSEAQARQLEPALNPDTRFAGAVQLPGDEVGNCRQFALLLKNAAHQLGVDFEFGKVVERVDGGGKLWLQGQPQPQTFDAIVLCSGLHSAGLLKPLGVHLPMAAVHGYSVSAQIREPLDAPRSAIVDERNRVVIARLGRWVRASGLMELGQPDPKAGYQTLYRILQDWFPGAPLLSSGVQEWHGSRPMLPDGLPVVGPSGIPGLWLNLGHGDHGWTLSCGSALVLTQLIEGRTPDVDTRGLTLQRWQR